MKAIEHSEVCPRGGFTLVELLAVIAVIAIVAGLVIGAAGVAGKKADVARAEAEIQIIANALEKYRGDYGTYPHVLPAAALAVESAVTNKLGQYVPDIRFFDPWGKGYQYLCDTNVSALTYEIRSAGPDTHFGNDGGDDSTEVKDDISNRR